MTPLQVWIQKGVDADHELKVIAGWLGVSLPTIKAYRSGRRRPGRDVIDTIAMVTMLKRAELLKMPERPHA